MDLTVRQALARSGGVATTAELEQCGVSRGTLRWALRRGDVLRVAPGTIADASTWARTDPGARHLTLLRRISGGSAVAAGASAAVVWGLPLKDGPPVVPVLLRNRTRARPEHGGRTAAAVRRRAWLGDHEITEFGDIPVTTMARTAVDLARTVDVPWGLAGVDAALRSGVPRAELVACVRRHARSPGSRRAANVIGWADPRAESPLESVARGVMLLLGIPAPDLQVTVAGGGLRYRVDLLVREFRTVVEVDGRLKYDGRTADPERPWEEKRRRDHLLSWGYEVERFVASDYHRPQRWGRSLLRAFGRACDRHGLERPQIDPAFPGFGGTWPVVRS